MRKQIWQEQSVGGRTGLDLEALARFQVSSEDAAFPLENILNPASPGWRAAESGEQTIRLTFDAPQRVSRVKVVFTEKERARTQEFVLTWQGGAGEPWREIARQQYNFSPPYTITESEEYGCELAGVTVMELRIKPNLDGTGLASLQSLAIE